jgi:anaerobic ribonucleoside-triphosphate reductase
VLLEGRREKSGDSGLKDSGRLPPEGPCDLFRRIQKRDGRIVDFDPNKITEAIYKAAQSVGGKNRRRAESLTEYVILNLAQHHQESTSLLNIEQVQDAIERVLVDNGHYRTGRAFITYRNERARRRALRGELSRFPSELEDGVGTLERVSVSTSKGESIRWDRERIVKALVRETGLPYEEARKVSHAVELEIVHSKITHITSPLIRELTNAKLLQLGYESERRLHARIGLPVFDVEERLLGKENAKTSIEEEILRQYAMEKVLPLAAAEAHGAQDLHIHDLDLIHKPVECKQDLDLVQPCLWYSACGQAAGAADSEWTAFLAAWEREETRLLKVVGRRLVWMNVNTAIAFQAQREGLDLKRAVTQALDKLWRLAGAGTNRVAVVWRLAEKVHPHWRAKFIGARQLSLLPEDEIDTLNQNTLLEILRQVEEAGPNWMACGVEFEVVAEVDREAGMDPAVAKALAGCLKAHAPVRVLFRRGAVLADPRSEESASLLQTISLNFPRAAALAEGEDDRLAEWLEDRLHLAAQAHLAKRNLLHDRIKGKALDPLGSSRPFAPENGIWGIGVWGLTEMAEIHGKTAPSSDEGSLKWVLKLLARIRLRMEEIGSRFGLQMRLVANSDEWVVDRLSHSLMTAGIGCGAGSVETLLDVSADDPEGMIAEGKVHSLLAFGHVLAADEEEANRDASSWEEHLRFLASKTHVLGTTWAGKSHHCAQCGAMFGETGSVCEACGGEVVLEANRRGQGNISQIVRL